MASHKWLLKKPGSSQEVSLLLTPVDGKCFELQQKLKQQKERRKNTKDSEKVLVAEPKKASKAKATAKGAAKAKARATGKPNEDGVEDPSTTEAQVTLDGLLTRDKYFLDCLVLGVRSALTLARQRFGDLQDAQMDEAAQDMVHFDALAEESSSDDIFTYKQAEVHLLRIAINKAIIFALTGEVTLGGKVHRRWSSLRPALQAQVMSLYQKAGDKEPMMFDLMLMLIDFINV